MKIGIVDAKDIRRHCSTSLFASTYVDPTRYVDSCIARTEQTLKKAKVRLAVLQEERALILEGSPARALSPQGRLIAADEAAKASS